MVRLPSLICPSCQRTIAAIELGASRVATRFDDCLRQCDQCGIAASNGANPKTVTWIRRDPLENIPRESREGAYEALAQALNERNRPSKWHRFGFSTSEDAVTWVVFSHMLRSNKLMPALWKAGLVAENSLSIVPTLLLWGVSIDAGGAGSEIRRRLIDECTNLHEDRNSLSEPDVIIDLGEHGLIFIEVKYRSRNDSKLADYPGWSKYNSAAGLAREINDVRISGCYELARNWCILKQLGATRPATLVNLGPTKLFVGTEGARLDRFIAALATNEQSRCMKVSWPHFLGTGLDDGPVWFAQFCRNRGLTN